MEVPGISQLLLRSLTKIRTNSVVRIQPSHSSQKDRQGWYFLCCMSIHCPKTIIICHDWSRWDGIRVYLILLYGLHMCRYTCKQKPVIFRGIHSRPDRLGFYAEIHGRVSVGNLLLRLPNWLEYVNLSSGFPSSGATSSSSSSSSSPWREAATTTGGYIYNTNIIFSQSRFLKQSFSNGS